MHRIIVADDMIIEDIIDARLLVELGKHLSFRAAAGRLLMPTATVSRRLGRMEARAKVRLFERTTRKVTATPAGLLAIAHAQKLLLEVEAIDVSIAALHSKATGTVRLTTPVIFGQALLSPAIDRFLGRFPQCDLAIDLTDRQVDMIDEGYDVAIRVGPVVDDMLVARPLGNVAAGLYRAAAAPSLELDDLAMTHFGLLALMDAQAHTVTLVSREGERRIVAVTPRIVCVNPWLLLAAGLSTEITVVLPDIVAASDVEAGRLVRVAAGWSARQAVVSIAFPSRRPLRPAVRGFVDIALECLPLLLPATKVIPAT